MKNAAAAPERERAKPFLPCTDPLAVQASILIQVESPLGT